VVTGFSTLPFDLTLMVYCASLFVTNPIMGPILEVKAIGLVDSNRCPLQEFA